MFKVVFSYYCLSVWYNICFIALLIPASSSLLFHISRSLSCLTLSNACFRSIRMWHSLSSSLDPDYLRRCMTSIVCSMVDIPCVKPAWYVPVFMTMGYLVSRRFLIAFSTAFHIVGRMPIGLMSLSVFAMGVPFLLSSIILPENRYGGRFMVVISAANLSAIISATVILVVKLY